MTYQLLLTTLGQQKLAAAANAGSQPVRITQFAVGQGVNVDFSQRLDQQVLVSKRYQGAVLNVSATATVGQYEITCVIPQNQGGWTIREFGLIDNAGDLIWVGRLPEVQKPAANSTAAVDYRIKAVVQIANPDVTLVIDANIIMASQAWAIAQFVPLSHLTDDDPHPEYALRSLLADYILIINELQGDLMSTQFTLLSERLTVIENQIANILSKKDISVGDIYTTTLAHANAAAVAAHHGYGTWERFAEGRTLVGYSSKTTDQADYKTIGNEFGENEHTLSVDEMPSHKHSQNDVYNKFIGLAASVMASAKYSIYTNVTGGSTMLTAASFDNISSESEYQIGKLSSVALSESTEVSQGGDQPHNNIQPSKVVAHWLRTA